MDSFISERMLKLTSKTASSKIMLALVGASYSTVKWRIRLQQLRIAPLEGISATKAGSSFLKKGP